MADWYLVFQMGINYLVLRLFLWLIVCLMHTFDMPTTKTLGTYYMKKFLETHFPTHSQVGLVLLAPELGMAVEASAADFLASDSLVIS